MNLRNDLRPFDPAVTNLTDADWITADAALERIVATPPTADPALPPMHPAAEPARPAPGPSRRPGARRLVPVLVAASVLATGLVFWPRPGEDGSAYASWTPTPRPVTGSVQEAVAAACRRQLRGGGGLDLARARLVLSERRGDHVALLFRTDDPDVSGFCLARNRPGSTDVSDVDTAVGGSSGPAMSAPARGFTEGAVADFGAASITDGAAGRDVVAVTIRARGQAARATVRDGRYVAWWPGPTMTRDADGKPRLVLSYDVTFSDGTTLRDAQPTRPR